MKSSIFQNTYHRKNLIDFCPGRFYRLGTCNLFWLLSRRLYSGECITYLAWITFQGRNLSNFFGGMYFGKLMISKIHSDFIWPLICFVYIDLPVPNISSQKCRDCETILSESIRRITAGGSFSKKAIPLHMMHLKIW